MASMVAKCVWERGREGGKAGARALPKPHPTPFYSLDTSSPAWTACAPPTPPSFLNRPPPWSPPSPASSAPLSRPGSRRATTAARRRRRRPTASWSRPTLCTRRCGRLGGGWRRGRGRRLPRGLRQNSSPFPFPAGTSPLDCYVDVATATMAPWAGALSAPSLEPGRPPFVPTVENARTLAVLTAMLVARVPVLLVGPAGGERREEERK